MGDWKKVDEYYLQNGEWTICKIPSVKNPYELWRGKERIGMFKTANEAKQFQSSGWPRSSSHPANKDSGAIAWSGNAKLVAERTQ